MAEDLTSVFFTCDIVDLTYLTETSFTNSDGSRNVTIYGPATSYMGGSFRASYLSQYCAQSNLTFVPWSPISDFTLSDPIQINEEGEEGYIINAYNMLAII